jgi:hypothetical protein
LQEAIAHYVGGDPIKSGTAFLDSVLVWEVVYQNWYPVLAVYPTLNSLLRRNVVLESSIRV